MNTKTKHEIFRVFSQLFFWSIIGGTCILFISQGWIDPKTEVDKSISCYVSDRLNILVYIIDFVALFITAGFVALFGGREYLKLVREEISRAFYTLGAFTSVAMTVLTFFNGHISPHSSMLKSYMTAALCFFGFSAVGFLIYYWYSKKNED